MATKTKTYGLTKPEKDDHYDIGVMNENLDTIDVELEKAEMERNGVRSIEKGGTGAATAEAALVKLGALPLTGGTLSGTLKIETATPTISLNSLTSNRRTVLGTGSNGVAVLGNYSLEDEKDWTAYYLRQETVDLITLAQVVRVVDGTAKIYNLFGDHNKPSGTYTGNGDSTSRTINAGGVSKMILIWSSEGLALVTPAGGFIGYGSSNMIHFPSSGTTNSGNFSEGVLTLTSNHVALNANGIVYNYKVL